MVFLKTNQPQDEATRVTAFGYLNRQLKERERAGRVVAILTYNGVRRRVACYGQRIEDSQIFSALNMSTNKKISHPNLSRLDHWGRGSLVPLSAFTGKKTEEWVALIGIGVSPAHFGGEVIPFHD